LPPPDNPDDGVIRLSLAQPSAVVNVTAGVAGRVPVVFIAPADGSYTFMSSNNGSCDPKAYSTDTGSSSLDDDSGEGYNFMFSVTLTANQAYVFYAGAYSDKAGNYTVTVIEGAQSPPPEDIIF
jgi:hypothetical protein